MSEAFQTLKTSLFLTVLAFSALAGEERWVSTSPQLTELIFQMGLDRNLVGTSEASNYPPAAQKLPKIGNLFQPNLESVLGLRPTRVLWDDSSFQSSLDAQLKKLGIVSEKYSLKSVEGLFQTAQALRGSGYWVDQTLLKKSEAAWRNPKHRIREESYLVLAWIDPPILFGKDTFFISLLEGLGARPLFPRQWNSHFLKVSEEWLLTQVPDRVLFLSHDPQQTQEFKNKCQKWWPKKTPDCSALSAENFARASFTPLLHLDELWAEAREIKP